VCSCSYSIANDLRGKTIVCSSCTNQIAIPAATAVPRPDDERARFIDRSARRAAPPPAAARPRRRPDDSDEEDGRDARRFRKTRRQRQGPSPALLAVCGGGALAVLCLVVGLILLLGRGSAAAQPLDPAVQVANNGPQPADNNGGAGQAAPAQPAEPPPPAPPLPAEDGPALTGPEVYQHVLRSTVWIVTRHQGGLLAGGPPVGPPGGRPPFGPGPGAGGPDTLAGTQWGGSETLQGFGPLRFEFQAGGRAIMHDAKETTTGTYAQHGQSVTLTFYEGSVTYTGRVNGQTMSGTASNGETTWTWNLTRGAAAAGPPAVGQGPGMPNRPGFPGMPNGPGGILGRPNPGIGGMPNPGGILGGQRPPFGPPNFTGRPNPGFPGMPNPGGGIRGNLPGFPNMPNPGGVPPGQFPGIRGFRAPSGGDAVANVALQNLSTGTGSLIDTRNRLIVTNCHVVGDAQEVTIYFPQYEKGELIAKRDLYTRKPGLRGRVVLREERCDLALVQLDRLPEGVRALPLARHAAKPAQQVHSVGNPGASGALWVYSPGRVRQVFPDTWKVRDGLDRHVHTYEAMKLETDSPINPGDSGGPLVNDHARMVGVAHASNLDAQNMSIFIEVSEVRTLITRYYQNLGQAWTPDS
jgi:S1-C subfamily serine protease